MSPSWKRPNSALDVGVDEAEQLALRDQRHDEAAALVERARRPRGRGAALALRVRRASSSQGVTARSRSASLSPVRQQRAGDLQAAWRSVEHQQHALGAGELGHLVDQELAQFGLALELVQAQAGLDQALEGFLQAGLAGQVRLDALARQALRARVGHPGLHHGAVVGALAEVVAAQALVLQRLRRLEQEGEGLGQRLARLGVAAVGAQRPAVLPPQRQRVAAVLRA